MEIPWRGVRFGLGLLEIGRTWGAVPREPPSADEALAFLGEAWRLGVRIYDTAASYGLSEARLGAFLETLPGGERETACIATKFGEHWDDRCGQPFVDHSYDALCRSLDLSLHRLHRIDVLQVHKTTAGLLRSEGVNRALDRASECGVRLFGASVADAEAGRAALASGRFGQLQLPFNRENRQLQGVIAEAKERGFMIFANRPFGMGHLVSGLEGGERMPAIRDCLDFVRAQRFDGAVLVGTASAEHLREDYDAFTADPLEAGV